MEIKDQDLQTFITLYQRAYGVTFNFEEAEQELSKLLQLYTVVYLTPITFAEPTKHPSVIVTLNKPSLHPK